ncbi:MAG: hypothetical protein HY660_12295, partial [Armatimonadetes bacterium]|nr:hypothetical protein [Armatimonadota bacterium]
MRASVTGRLASAMLMVLALAAALAVSPSPPASAQPRERNQVVLGFYQDVDTFNVLTLSTDAGSIAIRAFMDPLVEGDPKWKYQPILVSEIPSLVNKMWRVLPNGRMELTWKLRPNVRWHDGKPFTSADVLFTHQLATDSRIPVTYSLCGNAPHIESVQAPDPLTVVVTYRRVYAFAYQCVVEGSRWGAVPRHIFEPVYQRNPAGIKEMALGKDARLTIGNGPFRFRHWLRGNEIFFEANADYWRGRPKTGRLFFRYFADVNTLLTNLVAGAVDVVGPAPSGIFFGQGLQLEEL